MIINVNIEPYNIPPYGAYIYFLTVIYFVLRYLPANRTSAAAAVAVGACRSIVGKRRADYEWTGSSGT